MNFKLPLLRLSLALFFVAVFFLYRSPAEAPLTLDMGRFAFLKEEKEEGDKDEKASYSKERWLQEFKMLRNPITGKIPDNYRQIELAVAARIPEKGGGNPFIMNAQSGNSTTVANTYINIGPNNVAGRSRTLGIDSRNANIMITGGTTGGIFRSTNGGQSWTFVSPENDIRSANSIVQDPTAPDTWYCGTGEAYYPVSTADVSNATYGFGIYKSTDNGATWSKLPFTVANNNESAFDNAFDLVHRIAVHPTTGHVYAASHRRIMRSTDKGATWTAVLEGTSPTSAMGGLTEVLITPSATNPKIFVGVTGENPDRNFIGVWESTTGNTGSWTRIAGGVKDAADSVAGWRPYGTWGRVVLALNGTANQLFVLYKNGQSATGSNPRPEADLFRANLAGTPPAYAWTNLNAYVPDEPNYNEEGIDPYTTQFNGFNMSIAVKPDNNNIIFIGGTNIHRVHLNETDPAKKFRRIGGYGEGFFPQDENFIYPEHHPDIHWIYFHNNSNDRLYTASDGGIHITQTSVLADTVRWTPLNTNLQTLQYQFVNINPIPEGNFDFIIGSAQDNGTLVNLNFQNSNPSIREEHIPILSGDGASSAVGGFTKTGTNWKQYWFASVTSGAIFRYEVDLTTGNDPNIGITNFDDITPTGLRGAGQWLTMFVNDPDSTEHVYYNNRDRLWRTKSASTVTSGTWTEITGVAATVPSDNDFTAMAISRKRNDLKYLFFATEGGRVYRLDNANLAPANATPIEITPPQMTQFSYVAGIALNPRNADTALVVVSNYDQGGQVINNIFWSGNATAASPTWQVIDGALGPVSSQSCAIVLTTNGVEYYVGTSVGLYSTTQINGNNTSWLNEGGGMMKRAIIRNLVNRQRDNTLVVGTHGNGGFIARIGNAVNLDAPPGPVDSRFITSVFPTVTRGTLNFRIGNLTGFQRISVRVYDFKGSLVYEQSRAYSNGSLPLTNLASGTYILQIVSSDGKHKHVQKFIKQ